MRSACASFIGCSHEDSRADALEPHRNPQFAVARPSATGGNLSSACAQRAHCVRRACGKDRPFSPPPGGYAGHEDSFSKHASVRSIGCGRSSADCARSRALSTGPPVGFVDMRAAAWPQRCSRPGPPAPARELRRRTEGGRKAHGRWTEGTLVRQRDVASLEAGRRTAPKRPPKAPGRWMEGAWAVQKAERRRAPATV